MKIQSDYSHWMSIGEYIYFTNNDHDDSGNKFKAFAFDQ